jgi:PleD family two-component response regulator
VIRRDATVLDPTTNLRQVADLWAVLFRAPGGSEESGSEASPNSQRNLDRSNPAQSGLGPILVVDDDVAIREIVVEILELEGYPVEQAANGREALQHILNHPPSLILLDMRMPILDGWGVARALEQRGLRFPIVVMTAAHNART